MRGKTKLVLFFLGLAGHVHSAPLIQYDELVGDRYAVLKVFDGDRLVRAIRGAPSGHGTFKKIDPPYFSEDKKNMLFIQVYGGARASDLSSYSGGSYCGVVNIQTGCVVTRKTIEFCEGVFAKDGEWDGAIDPDLTIEDYLPKAQQYSYGRSMRHEEDAVSSIENLLACDPPDGKNIAAYKTFLGGDVYISESTEEILRPMLERIEREQNALQKNDPEHPGNTYSHPFGEKFDYSVIADSGTRRLDRLVARYMSSLRDTCLYVEILDPEKDWKPALQKRICSFNDKGFNDGFAYAGFTNIEFTNNGLSADLTLIPLIPRHENDLHCTIKLADDEIGPLVCTSGFDDETSDKKI